MMKKYTLQSLNKTFVIEVPLASSKSESNRALILDALTGFQSQLQNLSTARDTQTMIRLLKSKEETADVLDAGTTMRFLSAYFALTNQKKTLIGTPRMCQRPIGILIEALKMIGMDIKYLQNEGFPPLQIEGFSTQKNHQISIRGDVSSQFISALLMIAPSLPKGLEIELLGVVVSKPYIEMTIEQMRCFGAEVQTNWSENKLTVSPQPYQAISYQVESDWSGASYWFSIVGLSPFADTRVHLLGLKQHSLQGDSAIVEMMDKLGVQSRFDERGVWLSKKQSALSLEIDFANCPDLAQTVVAYAAIKGIELELIGIESLKIKETDRIKALQEEIKKIGASLEEIETNHRYKLIPCPKASTITSVSIHTYEDHRMAMAFAPWALLIDQVIIEDPDVVAKSYPSFWQDLEKIVKIS